MQYKILKEFCRPNMEREVNKHLAAGWELAGGVQVAVSPDRNNKGSHTCFYQSLTKQDK